MSPSRPLRCCAAPGCGELVSKGRCPRHQRQARQHHRRYQRGETAYNSARWIRLRDRFRADHPFCVNADKGDPRCTLLTDHVDHIVPHRGDPTLMFDEANLAGVCAACHGRKTSAEVGFGG